MPARRIGLTGGIGSGKSTVADFWVEAGATLVDTDAISRQLTAVGGAALPLIAAAFGAHMIDADGALDRAQMREQVFRDHEAKQRLEALLHPLITARAMSEADAATTALVVFDVPLLVESGRWRARVERLLVVDCEERTQIERVMQRSGGSWTREAVQAVIDQQASRTMRRASADAVIYNDGSTTLAQLREQVQRLAADWSA
ncbi:MAG TPA: dephospho-CoA kinase [Burkholderiaceae bacterium]|jgi:dephospho-CoA kinase